KCLLYTIYNSYITHAKKEVVSSCHGGECMLITLDLESEVPIYLQLRNKIIEGIASQSFQPGDTLPSVRQMASDLRVNMHTVNKSYQLLKQDGFLLIHRQKGVVIHPDG